MGFMKSSVDEINWIHPVFLLK